jgi:hypothetical protein
MVLISCNFINPKEKEPTFVYIPHFEFDAGPGHGTSSEKITELWVFGNDNILSIVDTPAMVPVLADGRTDIRIAAGIKNNGIGTTRIMYPFYTPYITSINPNPFKVDTIIPTFTYASNVDIDQWDWDNTTPPMVAESNNNGNYSIVDDASVAFEGSRCGLISIEDGESYAYHRLDEAITLTSGAISFLELNYSCNQRFAVGVLTYTGGTVNKNLVLIVNPTTSGVTAKWNKIYVDLGFVAQQNPSASYHKIYFEMNAESGTRPLNLFLDNIKFVRYQQ